jgi:outer membrane biogenesis lipoprotein LolB
MKKFLLIIFILLLTGCTDRVNVNTETVNDAFRLCTDQGGLRSLTVDDHQRFTAWCQNGRYFNSKYLPIKPTSNN